MQSRNEFELQRDVRLFHDMIALEQRYLDENNFGCEKKARIEASIAGMKAELELAKAAVALRKLQTFKPILVHAA